MVDVDSMSGIVDFKIQSRFQLDTLTDTLRYFRAFSSVVRQMPGYTSQRRDTVRTLPN